MLYYINELNKNKGMLTYRQRVKFKRFANRNFILFHIRDPNIYIYIYDSDEYFIWLNLINKVYLIGARKYINSKII